MANTNEEVDKGTSITVNGREYQLGDKLGDGSFADVYTLQGTDMAVKILKKVKKDWYPKLRKKFEMEAQVIEDLQKGRPDGHPNLIKVRHYSPDSTVGGRMFYATDAHDTNLHKYSRDPANKMTFRDAMAIALQIGAAAEYVFDTPIDEEEHKVRALDDIKPENVLIDRPKKEGKFPKVTVADLNMAAYEKKKTGGTHSYVLASGVPKELPEEFVRNFTYYTFPLLLGNNPGYTPIEPSQRTDVFSLAQIVSLDLIPYSVKTPKEDAVKDITATIDQHAPRVNAREGPENFLAFLDALELKIEELGLGDEEVYSIRSDITQAKIERYGLESIISKIDGAENHEAILSATSQVAEITSKKKMPKSLEIGLKRRLSDQAHSVISGYVEAAIDTDDIVNLLNMASDLDKQGVLGDNKLAVYTAMRDRAYYLVTDFLDNQRSSLKKEAIKIFSRTSGAFGRHAFSENADIGEVAQKVQQDISWLDEKMPLVENYESLVNMFDLTETTDRFGVRDEQERDRESMKRVSYLKDTLIKVKKDCESAIDFLSHVHRIRESNETLSVPPPLLRPPAYRRAYERIRQYALPAVIAVLTASVLLFATSRCDEEPANPAPAAEQADPEN